MWIPLLFLLSCQKASWSSVQDCKTLKMGTDKDNCWSIHLLEVFSKNPQEGMTILQQEISNQRIKDFLLLEITREIDPTSLQFCQQIKDKALGDRCRLLVSRPHLHRDTLRRNEKKHGVPSKKPDSNK